VRKKAKNRLLTRAAQKRACVFAASYRAATVRERFRNGVFQQPAKTIMDFFDIGRLDLQHAIGNNFVF
jgi:hypothetical protein